LIIIINKKPANIKAGDQCFI